jgi:hypothetical protein
MDVLQSLPCDTGHMRNILFALSAPLSLTIANQRLFWPLIDNVYSIRNSRDVKKPQPHKYRYVICRFKRTNEVSMSQQIRASTSKRVIKACDFDFALLEFENHVEYHPLSQQNHDHSLDESDANKRNSFLLSLVQKDVSRGFAPAVIIGSLRPVGRPDIRTKLDLAGGKYLSRQDIINSGASWRLANPNALFVSHDDKGDISVQARAAFETLSKLKWLSNPLNATSLDGTIGQGIAFAHPIRVQRLVRFGHLTLIDSTHKTNQLEWKLFTLMARDNFGCWHPLAHALLSHEFGELIAEFLLAIKQWTGGNWQLRYALSDDSGAEQRAFRLAFPGLATGETEVCATTLF